MPEKSGMDEAKEKEKIKTLAIKIIWVSVGSCNTGGLKSLNLLETRKGGRIYRRHANMASI
jgi:hypothetical protein